MKELKKNNSLNSHLVLFDKPKTIIANADIEQVHGMLISTYLNPETEKPETVRTLLSGSFLEPCIDLDGLCDADHIYEFKNLPTYTVADVKEIVLRTIAEVDPSYIFHKLHKLGFRFEKERETFTLKLKKTENGWSANGDLAFWIPLERTWIPSALENIIDLQGSLNCRIKLVAQDESEIPKETIDLMNRILDNHSKYRIWAHRYFDKEQCWNDGEYTYFHDGREEPMTRQEFIDKFPGSSELF